MTQSMVDQIANTVLYEGYLLYPYRASSVKNRQRFNFGVLLPREYSQAQFGNESWRMQAECLIAGEQPELRVRSRFLHLLERQMAEYSKGDPLSNSQHPHTPRLVDFLEVDGERYQTWQEAVEREVETPAWPVLDLIDSPRDLSFHFGPEQIDEEVLNHQNEPVGQLQRRQQAIQGTISVQATRLKKDLFKVRLTLQNTTPFVCVKNVTREAALMFSFASAHAVLNVQQGEFISLLEPADEYEEAVADCHQTGCFPVLVGEQGERQTLLASPIILYDYPEIAAESPGDFFDGTEMDEMLMLRVMTMTPEEQREMFSVDDQARRLLERAQSLPQEDMMQLHGKIRGMSPVDPQQRTSIQSSHTESSTHNNHKQI